MRYSKRSKIYKKLVKAIEALPPTTEVTLFTEEAAFLLHQKLKEQDIYRAKCLARARNKVII